MGAFVFFSRLVSALEAQQPAALPALVTRLEASPSPRVRELGAQRRRVLLAFEQPLDLKFTALDGRKVDTARWRGKVVVVDFWATWCVPCIKAIPKLKTLYARYHDQGLEIVNISVDRAEARPALEKLVAQLEIPWPQFFDGKAHATEYAVRYGVQPIPPCAARGTGRKDRGGQPHARKARGRNQTPAQALTPVPTPSPRDENCALLLGLLIYKPLPARSPKNPVSYQ